MNCHSIISIHDLLGSSINSREASSVLIDLVKADPCDYVELDFSSVDYISRSFADQFHIDKIDLAMRLHKSVVVSNASEAIINMLQTVAKSQRSGNKKVDDVPVYKYTSLTQLEEFLLGF